MQHRRRSHPSRNTVCWACWLVATNGPLCWRVGLGCQADVDVDCRQPLRAAASWHARYPTVTAARFECRSRLRTDGAAESGGRVPRCARRGACRMRRSPAAVLDALGSVGRRVRRSLVAACRPRRIWSPRSRNWRPMIDATPSASTLPDAAYTRPGPAGPGASVGFAGSGRSSAATDGAVIATLILSVVAQTLIGLLPLIQQVIVDHSILDQASMPLGPMLVLLVSTGMLGFTRQLRPPLPRRQGQRRHPARPATGHPPPPLRARLFAARRAVGRRRHVACRPAT